MGKSPQLDTALLKDAVKECTTMIGIIRKLGLPERHGSYLKLRKEIIKLQIDTSHWLGRAHAKGKPFQSKHDIKDVLTNPSPIVSRSVIKRRLLKEGLLINRCNICESDPVWLGKPITLVLDHINGNPVDYRIDNLQLVCPNCNSQLVTFCGRGQKKPMPKCNCGNIISKGHTRCRTCANRSNAKVRAKTYRIAWPDDETLRCKVNTQSVSKVAKELKVSETSVRNRLKATTQ